MSILMGIPSPCSIPPTILAYFAGSILPASNSFSALFKNCLSDYSTLDTRLISTSPNSVSIIEPSS